MDAKTLERFETSYIPEPNSGCWIWVGPCNDRQYGRISIRGKTYVAHRVSYKIHKGKIPNELVIDHLCRNTLCVNPDHLEAVTQRINRDRGNLQRFEIACDNGHLRSGDNYYIKEDGRRICRVCRRMRNKKWKEKKKRQIHDW